jgi:hypothetical protein
MGGDRSVTGLFAAIALFIKELMLLVSYVKNNAFLQPLAEKEEASLSPKEILNRVTC